MKVNFTPMVRTRVKKHHIYSRLKSITSVEKLKILHNSQYFIYTS